MKLLNVTMAGMIALGSSALMSGCFGKDEVDQFKDKLKQAQDDLKKGADQGKKGATTDLAPGKPESIPQGPQGTDGTAADLAKKLTGTWTTECIPLFSLYQVVEITFQANTFQRKISLFPDRECEMSQNGGHEVKGTYELPGAMEGLDRVYKIDFAGRTEYGTTENTFDVFFLNNEETELYFGAHPGKTPEARDDELDLNAIFHRKY